MIPINDANKSYKQMIRTTTIKKTGQKVRFNVLITLDKPSGLSLAFNKNVYRRIVVQTGTILIVLTNGNVHAAVVHRARNT